MADLILLNGKIVTVNSNFSIASALAVKGDKIIGIDSNEKIGKLAKAQTQIIDLKGRTVIPGLIDAHAHPERASLSEINEELPDLHSISELLGWIEHQASIKKEGEWIIHPKMFYTRLEELRPPTLSELDEVSPNNPVFLNGSFGGIINSAAIKASGFTEKEIADELDREPKTGLLNSFIRSSAFSLLKIPPKVKLTYQDEVDALKIMFSNYNKFGITGVISGYGDLNNYKRYEELSQKGELTVRISQNFLLPFNIRDSKERLVDSLKTFPLVTGKGNEWVRTGALKIFVDGGILTGTAFLREPWGEKAKDIYNINDAKYRGIINYTYKDLLNIVSAACETGWTFTAHCTGGGGVDLLLNVFEEVNKSQPIKNLRVSIIHGNFFTKEAIERMKKLGVIANVQAAWFYKDADAMKYILGEGRVKTFNPYRSMIENGVILCGGSDHMVKLDANTSINPYNPFLAMWSMIARETEKGSVICPKEAITREQALKMYTINNAFTTFEESLKGSLEIGKLADLAVLSNDPLTCPADQIKEIQSVLTLVGGKIVYSSK
ncbi:MAG: amidohydrolase [Draconibacterium sp.]|nr:amidohydrolase [Draconibacterium sp.]